jgi:bleomycin hydrolase
MNRLIISIFFLSFIGFSYSQKDPIKFKNSKESNYNFTKLFHYGTTPVQDQGWTGTCWSFSCLSFFESELIRMGTANPSILSEMYIVRRAYESKAEKYIRMDGKTNFSEGGAFHDIPFVIKKYGVVPLSVYDGLVGRTKSYNHGIMFQELESSVKEQQTSGNGITESWKKNFSKILDEHLGKVPNEFEVEGKKYTSNSYADAIGLNMDNYISLTSFTNHEMYKECELEIPDNWAWGDSYNVGLEELLMACKEALKNGYTLAWGADVSEDGFSFSNGLAIVPDATDIEVKGNDNKNFSNAGAEKLSDAFKNPTKELNITPELRQLGYDNKTTTDDHGMHIVGLYQDQNGTNYFLVKNSWGTDNYPDGYLYVSENYFKYKTINIYLHKDGIYPELRAKLNL